MADRAPINTEYEIKLSAGYEVKLSEIDITQLVMKAAYYDEIMGRLMSATVDKPYYGSLVICYNRDMEWIVSENGTKTSYGNPADAILAYIARIVEKENDNG